VRRYREYLTRRPDAPNRAEVEARIARLAPPPPATALTPEPPYAPPPPGTVPTRPPATEDGLSEPRSLDEPMPFAQPPRRVPYDESMARRVPFRRGGAVAPPPPEPMSPPPATTAPPPEQAPMPAPPPAPTPEPKHARPFYKKWWFWVFVGVGAVIVIDAAASSHSDNNPAKVPSALGATIFSF